MPEPIADVIRDELRRRLEQRLWSEERAEVRGSTSVPCDHDDCGD